MKQEQGSDMICCSKIHMYKDKEMIEPNFEEWGWPLIKISFKTMHSQNY